MLPPPPPRFQKRRLEKAQKKREERAVDRLERELLKGSSSHSRDRNCSPHRATCFPLDLLAGTSGLFQAHY